MGILGTALEDLGERKRWKFLVAIGVRLEALGSDVPKFIKGK